MKQNEIIKYQEGSYEDLKRQSEFKTFSDELLSKCGLTKEQLSEPIDEKFQSGAIGAKRFKQYMTEIDLMRNHYFPNWKSLVNKIIDEENNALIGLA